MLLSRNFCAKRIVAVSQCGKMINLLSPKKISSNQLFSYFISKTVIFTKFLQKKCESKFPKFTPALCWQKFRESNGFDKEITKS